MRKLALSTFVSVIAVLGLTTGVAAAAEPANQACVGTTFSPLASNQPAPGTFGSGVVSFAQDDFGRPGIGGAINFLQAGLADDADVPNTCND
jgi:hypothetical protein